MRETLAGVPDGLAPLVLARLAEEEGAGSPPLLLHVARDDRRLEALADGLAFFAPKVRVIQLPAWDTVPYDRIGPNAEIVATRVASLARLAAAARKGPTVVLTTVNAILQRLPPREFIRRSLKTIAPGQRIDMNQLIQRLSLAGFQRTGTVMEPGEYAVRGGILDLFPPGRLAPVRLDFFGDTLEHIKAFDPETQRTGKIVQRLTLMPISEVAFGEEAEKRFRGNYVETFGPATSEDPLYEAVSAGQRYPGMEHWLPLFHDHLETLFDYVPDAPVSFDHLAEEAVEERLALIADHYEARVKGLESLTFGAPPYKPVPAAAMFLTRKEWGERQAGRSVRHMTPFEEASAKAKGELRSFGGRVGRNFALERSGEGGNVFDAAAQHVRTLQAQGKRVIIASFSQGARERLLALLGEHQLANARKVESFAEAGALPADARRVRRAAARAGLRDARPGRHRRAGHPGRPAGAAPAQGAARLRRHHRGDQPGRRRFRRARRPRHRPLRRPHHHHRAGRAARLPGDRLRGRRQALSAGREHRAAVALRLGRRRRCSSTASAASPGRRARRASSSASARSPPSSSRWRRCGSCARRR